MDFNEYQEKASRTINQKNNDIELQRHALFGLASEVGELHGLYQKIYQGHGLNLIHVKKELGDILWFIAEFCTASGWKLDDIAKINIEKLKGRYPDGFSENDSLYRDIYDV